MGKYKKIIYTACFLFLISLDQISKYIIRAKGGFYICNTNLAFGLKVNYAFIIITIILLIFFIYNFKIKKFIGNWKLEIGNLNKYTSLILILILSGGASNIIDRLRFGCVIDFIDLKFWPVFNFADIYITLGVILILINHGKSKRETNF